MCNNLQVTCTDNMQGKGPLRRPCRWLRTSTGGHSVVQRRPGGDHTGDAALSSSQTGGWYLVRRYLKPVGRGGVIAEADRREGEPIVAR